MHEKDNPSFRGELIKFTFFLTIHMYIDNSFFFITCVANSYCVRYSEPLCNDAQVSTAAPIKDEVLYQYKVFSCCEQNWHSFDILF
jgi:hypothetical protein